MADHNQVYTLLISRHEHVRESLIKAGRALKKMMYTDKTLPGRLEHKPTKWYAEFKNTNYIHSAKDLKGASPYIFYVFDSSGTRVPAADATLSPLGKKYASFVRMCAKFDKLYNEEKQLKATLESLNKLNLGVKVKWNNKNRITAVRHEKKFIPVETFVTATLIEGVPHEP